MNFRRICRIAAGQKCGSDAGESISSMRKWLAIAFAIAIFMLPAQGVRSGNSETRESRFSVYSHGLRIGEATSVCSLSNSGEHNSFRFSNSTRINANFLIRSYSLENHEDAVVGKEGTLRYSRSGKENGVATTVEGALENNEFRLRITENNSPRTLAIPRERYDYTTMECPEIRLKHEGEKMTARLLDLENLEVVTRHYNWVRSEELQIGGRKYTFRVVDFEDKNKKCRRWVRPDNVGVMIARQEGQGKSGAYSVKLVEYKSLVN